MLFKPLFKPTKDFDDFDNIHTLESEGEHDNNRPKC